MRKDYAFSVAAMAILLSGALSSCDQSDGFKSEEDNTFDVKLAKSPDFRLYSGSEVISSTFTKTRGDVSVNVNYFKIQDYGGGKSDWMKNQYPLLYQYFDNAPAKSADRNEQVSQAEYAAVMTYLANHPDEGGLTCDLTRYFIQNVGSSDDQYQLEFKNGGSVHHTQQVTGGNQMDYLEFNGTHIFDYNAHNGPRALCIDIPLVSPSYRDSYANLKQSDHYRFYVIEYAGKKNLYLCFDYATKKYDNGQMDFQGDGVYNDWVIKIIPADGSEITDPDNGGGGGGDEEPDELDFYATDHVEVNLSVNDKHEEGDWIHTKLSIHVRAVTDVEIFIPVSQSYYCDVDDMNLVISHALDLLKFIPQPSTETFQIVNSETSEVYEVSATVAFEANGIRITTHGMTAGLQEYLNNKYQDGLTFEIWNYYNVNAIDRETLKPFLDASTVTFTTDPTLYVNAFAPIGDDDHKNPWDCVVTPPSAYSVFAERTPEKYYDYDVIYKK